MQKNILSVILLLSIWMFESAFVLYNNPDFSAILKKSDFHRGGHIKGITWDLLVSNYEKEQLKNEISLLVEASSFEQSLFALITFLEPKKFKGQKLLLRDNNMWFSKIDLRTPVPISNRQRLTGSAANADVASANYFNEYKISETGEETYATKECWVLTLVAKNALVPYASIKYWVTKEENFGLRAEFYGTSGKLIKTATFEYKNRVLYNGKAESLISLIKIEDIIDTNAKTELSISNIRFVDFDNSKFQKDRLQD